MRLIAAAVLLVLTLAASVFMLRSPFHYAQQDRDNINVSATQQHLTGTDDLGRDRTVRLAGALLLGLLGAAAASALAGGLAVGAGLGAAFAPAWLGRTILYLSDVALTLPWLFLLMMVRSALPLNLAPIHSATLTFLLLGLLGWPAFVRANHARARTLRSAGWLVHGRAAGLRPLQLGCQLLPHLAPLLLTQFLIYIPVCIVAEANLGAMGLGVSEPLPSWGSMLLALQNSALTANTHWIYLPIALLVFVLLLLEMLLVEVKIVKINITVVKKILAIAFGAALALLLLPAPVFSQEISWSLKNDPGTFDPALVDEQAAERVRFLTGGVLLRFNRTTQQIEPALADRWTISPDGKLIVFHMRDNLRFSDGSPLNSADVAATLKRVLDPATKAPVADEFLDAKSVTVDAPDAFIVRVHLPKRVVGIGKVFDEIAIEPANHPSQGKVTAGSFFVADYKQGEFVRLARNPYYWRHDAKGVQLPYLAGVKLDILANRDQDELRFLRGQYQLIESVPAANFSVLAQKAPRAVHDLGPSLNTEQMWFNQSSAAPIPAFEKVWFASKNFRNAISLAIHRSDIARIAYDGHATPANGFVSPANKIWYNHALPPVQENVNAALAALAKDGFRKNGATLVDRDGHPVSFSLLTNAGNHAREKMASMLAQDLAAIGIKLNVVTLDFPALIDRLMHTQNYESALLGLSNVELDPSSMMNVWLSSSPNHQWNPSEKTPATLWEADLDRLMNAQAIAATDAERKRSVDRVQQIISEQQPFIYLVYPNALYAVSPSLSNAYLTVLQPGIVSNIDFIKAGAK